MTDAFWMQLGGNLAFALEVGGKIVGLLYWLDAEGLEREAAAAEGVDLPASGWYWVSVGRPRNAERVAEGLELRGDMTEEELAAAAQAALEDVASEVIADGSD